MIEESSFFPINQVIFVNLYYIDAEMSRIGNSFFRLTLENIWVWSKWFPIDPDTQTLSSYKICYLRLQ